MKAAHLSIPLSLFVLPLLLPMTSFRLRLACCVVAFSIADAFAAATASDDPLQSVGSAATEWLKVRSEGARIESEWRTERALLESLVTVMADRATALEDKRDQAMAKTAEERGDLESMQAKNAAAQVQLDTATSRLAALTARLVALRPALPPRLSAALELPYRSLADSELGAGERMQHAMAVLNRCAQFNHLIGVGEQIIETDAGAKSTEAIYWGLSHGYAIDRIERKAWVGAPVGGHWKWTPSADAYQPVAKLIAIYHDKADPEFVTVPASIAAAN